MGSVLGQGDEGQATSVLGKVLGKTGSVGLTWMMLDKQLEKVTNNLLHDLEAKESP